MNFDCPQKFQQGNHWLSMHNGLKGTPLENAAIANGHYSDSLSRKLDRILNDHEYSDVEDAENITVQGNLEMQLSKLLDDTEDEVSSSAWSSSSSIEHLSPRDFLGIGMFDGASNSNLELSSNPAQPLGVELAAALDSSSKHSSDSEETVGEEDGSVLCVYNNAAIDLKNGWVGSDNESATSKTDEDKSKHHKRPSSAMYPCSSSSSDSDSDEVCIKNPHAPKQYSVRMSSSSSHCDNGLQSNEAENGHSSDMPNSPVEYRPPTTQETIEKVLPVENNHLHESAPTTPTTKASTQQDHEELPLVNSSSTESPISTSLVEEEATTNTLKPATPSISSHRVSLSEEIRSEDSQENELELIKLQVCYINNILIGLTISCHP